MALMFFKGLLIAFIFGIPAGAIGILSSKRALEHGFKAGFITGLGSTAADTMYAFIGVMGLSLITDFLTAHEETISIVGGIVIILFGLSGLIPKKKESRMEKKEEAMDKTDSVEPNYWLFFGSAFSIAILNPATIVTFLAAFSAFKIFEGYSVIRGLSLVVGVFTGTTLWWLGLSAVVTHFRSKFSGKSSKYANVFFAAFMGVFGLIIIIRGLMGK